MKQAESRTCNSDLATPGEVATYLRTTEARLAQMRYQGTGPKYVKVGRRVLYRWTDIENYLNRISG